MHISVPQTVNTLKSSPKNGGGTAPLVVEMGACRGKLAGPREGDDGPKAVLSGTGALEEGTGGSRRERAEEEEAGRECPQKEMTSPVLPTQAGSALLGLPRHAFFLWVKCGSLDSAPAGLQPQRPCLLAVTVAAGTHELAELRLGSGKRGSARSTPCKAGFAAETSPSPHSPCPAKAGEPSHISRLQAD